MPIIHLTSPDGKPIEVDTSLIHALHSLGDGAAIVLRDGQAIGVVQSVNWVIARWKLATGHSEPMDIHPPL